jgi:ribonuclease HIII
LRGALHSELLVASRIASPFSIHLTPQSILQFSDCPRSLSDQFAQKWQLESAVKRLALKLKIEQRTKAESDTAVAASSILAREKFIDWIDAESEKLGVPLPKGAGAQVVETGRDLVTRIGDQVLANLAKTHFRTTGELL